jgi:CheY-like chemotaxis protein
MGIFDYFKGNTPPPSTPPADPKYLVLVVDDEPFIRESYQDLLTGEGYKVITAANGQEGINKAVQFHPDIIMLDLLMPIMDGMTAIPELKKNETTKDIPIIILTNAGSVENIKQASYYNVFTFLIKINVSPEEILKIMRQSLLGRRPSSTLATTDTPPPAAPTTPPPVTQ